MIVYDLTCAKSHLFEGWFRDGAAFEAQAGAGEIVCPTCGSTDIKKALATPNLTNCKKKTQTPPVPEPPKAAMEATNASEVRQALRNLRKTVEENFDFVGDTFAEEARKIHYGEVDQRNIYGETSDEEAEALLDEGVEVSRVPWIRREDS
jgi:hypothetical protein